MEISPLAGKRKVRFSLKEAEGKDVYVAGTFNNWNPRKNKLTYRNGAYVCTLLLARGSHQYKFVVDGVWCVDPECPEWVPNGVGSLNSVLTVA